MICSLENRPLRRHRLGPPDVYPQDSKQKEDELSNNNVKFGFSSHQIKDEYGSAKDLNISASKVSIFFNNILNLKRESNKLIDPGKKKSLGISKDHFLHVSPRTMQQTDNWFKDLSELKALTVLAKRVPMFNKKEDMFIKLFECAVPMQRAAWYIQMTAACTPATMEVRKKNRPQTDATLEWTNIFLGFLGALLAQYSKSLRAIASGGSSGMQSHTSGPMGEVLEIKQWKYFTQLLAHLYQEGLMDRGEVLCWLIERVEKGSELHLILPLTLQFIHEITLWEIAARKLAYAAAYQLNSLISQATQDAAGDSPPSHPPLHKVFLELMMCTFTRPLLLGLSAILQLITLECTTAMVWCNLGEGRTQSPLHGSPLDIAPTAPSLLPLPPRRDNQTIRQQLRFFEDVIRSRSLASEVRWSAERSNSPGTTINRVLAVLDILDSYFFDRVDTLSGNSLDGLYAKIFSSGLPVGKEGEQHEEATLNALCEWAVSSRRFGEHRALVVSKLLEKRQVELQQSEGGENGGGEDNGSTCSANTPQGLPAFQSLLMKFLDNKAPIQRESPPNEFASLVLLFSELIRLEVFSHDAYMATLISRGDLSTTPLIGPQPPSSEARSSTGSTAGPQDDDSRIDADLDRILQRISQQNEIEAPESPSGGVKESGHNPMILKSGVQQQRANRHLQYTTHFPLPADDGNSHEANQRSILLFGVGKSRKEARHQLKEAGREVNRLFNKKHCLEVSEGGKVKKLWSSEYSFDTLINRVSSLSYFDQNVVLTSAANVCVDLLCPSSNHFPLVEHVSLLIQMMESALLVHGLLEMCTLILRELHEIEAQLTARQSSLAGLYVPSLALLIVGVLRRFHCSLLVYPDFAAQCFESLCRLVKPVTNPSECTSTDRSILWYLMDLYNASVLLQKEGGFAKAYPKVKGAFHKPMVPPNCHLLWTREFMKEHLRQPKKKVDPYLLRQLREDSDSRYSLCGNALEIVCALKDPLMVKDVAILCAELTAQCNELSGEWLGILKDLCTCPAICCCQDGLPEIRDALDITDGLVRTNLCAFVSVLVARHAVTLEDFVKHAAIPSLLSPKKKNHVESEWEAGVQLSCLLLLKLFKASKDNEMESVPPGLSSSLQKTNLFLAEEYLLSAAHTFMEVRAVQVILMTLLLLADTQQEKVLQKKEGDTASSSPWGNGDSGGPRGSEPPLSDILGTSDLSPQSNSFMAGFKMSQQKSTSGTSLATLSMKTLTTLCAEPWIRELLLRQGDVLCDSLCDEHLTHSQAQRLLRFLCQSTTTASGDARGPEDQSPSSTTDEHKRGISCTLQSVDQWSLRGARLDLLLRYKQVQGGESRGNSGELNRWVDSLASAIMDVFELSNRKDKDGKRSEPSVSDRAVWLVSPLVERLPPLVQSAILKAAATVLEYGTWTSRPKEGQPFLALIRVCLRGQEEQKDALLQSLKSQLEQFVAIDKTNLYDPNQSTALNNALQLRLSIVGLLLDSIQESSAQTQEYSLLLVQLVSRQVVDFSNNRNLLNSVIDMLATLVHTSLVSKTDGTAERQEENRKQYSTLCRKLRKEVGEKDAGASRLIRQLLPIPKKWLELIVCEANASSKAARMNSIDAENKHGLRVVERQRLLPMEVIGGLRNPAPIAWSWFSAIKTERKPLKCQDNHRLLLYHTHDMSKSEEYYLEPPPLPSEDLLDTPIQEKVSTPFSQFASAAASYPPSMPIGSPGMHGPGASPGAPMMVPSPIGAPQMMGPPASAANMGMGPKVPGPRMGPGPRPPMGYPPAPMRPSPDEKMMMMKQGPGGPPMMGGPRQMGPGGAMGPPHLMGPPMNPRMMMGPAGPMGGPPGPEMHPGAHPRMMFHQGPPPPPPVTQPTKTKRAPRKRKNSPRMPRSQTPPQNIPPPARGSPGPSQQGTFLNQPPAPPQQQQQQQQGVPGANWYNNTQGQPGPQQYFQPQMPNAPKRPRMMSQSKQAISEMIRARARGPSPTSFQMPQQPPQQGNQPQPNPMTPQHNIPVSSAPGAFPQQIRMRAMNPMQQQQQQQPGGAYQQMGNMVPPGAGPQGQAGGPQQGNFLVSTSSAGQGNYEMSIPTSVQQQNPQQQQQQQQGFPGMQAPGPQQNQFAAPRGPYGMNPQQQQQRMGPPMQRGQYGPGPMGGQAPNVTVQGSSFANRMPNPMQQYQQQMRHQQPQMMMQQQQGPPQQAGPMGMGSGGPQQGGPNMGRLVTKEDISRGDMNYLSDVTDLKYFSDVTRPETSQRCDRPEISQRVTALEYLSDVTDLKYLSDVTDLKYLSDVTDLRK
ncbi:unnamed protein product [Cyprideis torosa]|uniref:Uncharacterized protein n=1 Tax=Cyprideis torosa TaxID=163714 RepID=A0A7R8ZJ94_9CRUS|nr:unnamed protein product [Cyprideis torosa]CAG0888090.1 unnamed protein product [Cyprideis torosa]